MADDNMANQSPEEIEREIAQTRARMQDTFSALETRLNPQRLKDDATRTIRRETVGRVENYTDNVTQTVKGASADVFETIKRNPVPAALAAVGLGWLFMEARDNNRTRRFNRYDYDADYDYRYGPGYEPYQRSRRQGYGYEEEGMTGRLRGATGQVQDKAGEMTDRMQDKAGQMADRVQDTASQAANRVQDTASQAVGQVQDTAGQMADRIQYTAGQATNRLQEMMDESPLLVGAAALALGAAIGLSLPTTQKEQELLGPKRDQLMEKAQAAASETVDKAQQVVQRAGEAAKDAAKDEAQKQNLTSSS